MSAEAAKDGELYLYFCSSNCYKQTLTAYPPAKPPPDLLDHIESQNKRPKVEQPENVVIKKESPETVTLFKYVISINSHSSF